MTIAKNSTAMKLATVAIAVLMVVGMVFSLTAPAHAALTASQIDSIVSLLASFGADQATIDNVQLSLEGKATTGTGTTTGGSSSSVCPYTWTRSLTSGATGADVMNLQKFLNSDSATMVAASGVGSAGNETEYFGSLSISAVAKFQNKYAAQVLTPVGLTTGTGYFGPSTRAHMNSLCTSAPTTGGETGGTTPPVSVGTGVTVGSASQPANTLAPNSAARVPFTNFTVTAGSDGDVTVTGVTVERVGLGANAVFSGVVLLDEDGLQMSTAKTLNSDNQSKIGGTFTVPAGTTKTYTVAGNMAADNSTRAGQVVGLNVVAVNTTATVSGSLPVSGALHTINASLTIGTVTPSRGVDDPNTTSDKEIGTTNFLFSSVKLTAGSAEKVRLHSFRWNQSGSASRDDLENVMVYVDGVAYIPVVSSDGKFYTASFGDGLVIAKGLSKEVSIRADILSGSARTVAFDVDKITDIHVTGETYMYGITPSTSGNGFSATSPVYNANGVVTIANGSITVTKATSVSAQNIGVNVANQTLGGIDVEVDGESISVASMAFTVATSSTGVGLLTNVVMVDSNGSVVAGPVDTTGAGTTVTFTDTVTFPVGKNVYTIKGQTPSGLTNNGTYTLSLIPSSAFGTVTGQSTGNTITPAPATTVTMNAMTVKTGNTVISAAAAPAAQTMVAGAQGFTFANYQFDATASGEDVRFTTLTPLLAHVGGVPEYLTGCQLWDGSTALNTGSNKVDVSSSWTTGDVTFTLDSGGVTVPKGTIKTLALKCDLSTSATTSPYTWGMTTSQTGTALDSGADVTATASGAGQAMTPTSGGTFTVTLDSSSPSYALAAAGSSDAVLGVLKFTSANEEMKVTKVALELTNTSSSSASDLTSVTLWDGSTQVGTVIFTGTNSNATATLTASFMVPKDDSKTMTMKGNLAAIGTSQVGTQGALIAVNFDGDDPTGTQAIGQDAGGTVSHNGSSDTASSGVRVFRSFPTLAKIQTGIATSLANGDQPLLRFSITADSSDDLGIDSFAYRVSTTTVTVASLNAFAYTDSSFSTPVSGVNTSGQLDDTNQVWVSSSANIVVDIDNSGTDTVLQIPAGDTRYFEIRGDVLDAATGDSVSTSLQGDSSYGSLEFLMGAASTVNTNSNFVWTPNATTTSVNAHVDFTSGYGVTGLPGTGMNSQTISY